MSSRYLLLRDIRYCDRRCVVVRKFCFSSCMAVLPLEDCVHVEEYLLCDFYQRTLRI